MTASTRIGTVIIGAGAAGLAVAAGLAERGLPYRLLERGPHLGTSWRARYDGLRLHTPRLLSGLPGRPIPRRYGRWVRRDDLVAYLEDYARAYAIEPETGTTVRTLRREGSGWRVETDRGELAATEVVVTTGQTRVPIVPDWPGAATFAGERLHAVDYRTPDAYAGQRVLVVGAGNSATEIAVELTRTAAQVWLSVRRPPAIVRRDSLGIPSQVISIACAPLPDAVTDPMSALLRRLTVPDLSAYGLPAPRRGITEFRRSQTTPVLDHGFVDAVRSGAVTVVAPIERIGPTSAHLTDGRELAPDTILAATGYSPGLEALVDGLDWLDDRGCPVGHGGTGVPGAPGLYAVGISVELTGQLRRIGVEARQVARMIADRGSSSLANG